MSAKRLFSVLLVIIFTITVPFLDAEAKGKKKKKEEKKSEQFEGVDTMNFGKLSIVSMTVGAEVFIDGNLVGTIPLKEAIQLAIGQHTLKVKKRGFTDYLDTFDISPEETLELEIDLIAYAGIVKITANVEQVNIFLDGKPIGALPFDREIPIGNHEIMLKRPGYKDAKQTIDISAGQEYNLKFDLEAIPNWVPPEARVKTPWYKSWWFWTITGVVIAGGTTTGIILGTRGKTAAPNANHSIILP